MLTTPMLSPIGAIIAETRADTDVQALVGVDECGFRRVRGGEPVGDGTCANGTTKRTADAQGPGHYRPFVVFVTLDDSPHPRVPIQRAVYSFACYGSTFANAREVYGAVVKALHLVGERVKSNGLGIYISFVDTGEEQDKDPDTGQPVVRGTVVVHAAAQAVT